ncbi:amino acid permease-domain-containing protein [Dactylonectria estremocensis]|uniref:Amino acid permease-domain-containing protein n=1 Tax=Dactylonectria estremocensis TaxID=1079267 RepID=A0A9P9EX18_9HYPO|nr:amino acid permease-domain-containing protein [Dactylonectria estremocensis]
MSFIILSVTHLILSLVTMNADHIMLTGEAEVVEMMYLSNAGGSFGNKGIWRDTSAMRPEASPGPSSWMDGFRRAKRRQSKGLDSGYHATLQPVMSVQRDRHYDIRAANAKTATTALARKLKGRHLQMIAFGGAIGAGLFVASGNALYKGGPGSLLLSYLIIGIMQYCTMQSLCELCVFFPVTGSFSAFSTRFIDPSWGFAIGWNYFLMWLFILPLEIIAATFTVSYWNDTIPKAIFVTIFLVAIVAINLCGIKAYGEAEFIFSIIKITAIIGFILLGIIINVGGPPEGGYIGGSNWLHPGPFKNGFKGFCSVLAANPCKSLPMAVKQVFWRITIFYVTAALIVALLVPSDNPRLMGGNSHVYASASAFIIAIETAGVTILPSVMNAVILIAVISVGNSAVFGSSRTLLALAEQSHAPRFFAYVDKQGRPLMAILLAVCVGLMGFFADVEVHQTIFHWLLATASLSTLFTWGSICVCHIRFRTAWAYNAHSLDQLPFRSHSGVIGSWFAMIGYILVVTSQIYIAISPLETPGLDTSISGRVQNFFLRVMTIPVLLILYIGHKIYFRTQVVPVDKMDVETGRRPFRVYITAEQEEDKKRNWPFWKRVYNLIC